MLKSGYHNPEARCLYHAIAKYGCNALIVFGTLVMGLGRAFALDGSNTNTQRNIATTHFASGQQALQLVEDYDEDQSDPQDLSAFSSAFVAVGVYCLSGIPNSDVRPDPRRAHELFQYAATSFGDPNAQYNLARMYMVGAGSLAKDDIAAIRWLALAAKQGHPPSQALLGHMLFVGDGVLDQRARGLMWLEVAKDAAPNPEEQWIRELYQRDFQMSTDNDRRAAAAMLEALAKGTPSPIPAGSSVTSFLRPYNTPPTSSSPPAQ
jgi:uncharacterized protein